jgi:hypothetical protein
MAKVRELLEKLGEPSPHFLLSCAWIAEKEDGEIVGLSIMQSVPIIEPFKMVSNAHDGGEVLRKLFDMTQEFVRASKTPRVLMHTSHPAMKRMLASKEIGAVRMSDEFFDWRRERKEE